MEQRKNFNAAAQFGETLIRKHGHKGYMLCDSGDEYPVEGVCYVEIFERHDLCLDELRSLIHICDGHGVESYIIRGEFSLRKEFSFRVVFL